MIPLEVPVQLGRDEARRQAEAELAKGEYLDVQDAASDWWNRLIDWLTNIPSELDDLPSSQLGAVIVAVVVAVVLATVVILAGPLRGDRRIGEHAFLDDEERTAAQLRDEAVRLGQANEWTQAAIQRFRALVRGLSERGVIDETPGMTAREAVARTDGRLPGHAAALAGAATLFDGLAYGRRTATRVQYEQLVALDESVQQARPTAPAHEPADGEPLSPEGTRVSVAATDGGRP